MGAVLIASGLILAGCTQQMLGNSEDGAEEQSDRPLAGDPSRPDASPAAKDNLPGTQSSTPGGILDVASVGLGGEENSVAVLREGSLLIGTAEDVSANRGTKADVDPSCHNVSTSADGVAVACQDALLNYAPDGKKLRDVAVEGLVSSGTFAASGTAVAGVKGSEKVNFYDADGSKTGDAVVTSNTDETLLINPGEGQDQRAAVIDRSQTTISDVTLADQANNAALRIGQGVGEAAQGNGDDGVIVASDHRQQQVQIFTMRDVVRLHQEAPVGPSPWAVRWDADRQIAWVSTTGDNKLTGFRIDSGTPVPVAQFDTIADVRNVIDGANGQLLLISEDGQWQSLTSEDVDEGLQQGVDAKETFGSEILGGQN